MERSWWIVLILICNLSYGQVSSGAIANNRFLQRTNPQITRALNDGGSSLDHPEIQKLARQMVDLGIWSNLVFWIHEGLVKERVSGSDVFVPKAYDISGNIRDFQQSNTTYQPKLLNGGIDFSVNNQLSRTITYSNSTISFCFYINTRTALILTDRIIDELALLIWFNDVGGSNYSIQFTHFFTSGSINGRTNDIIPYNTWAFICITYDATSTANIPILYVNGVNETGITGGTPTGTRSTSTRLHLGNALVPLANRPLNGTLSDIRKYNVILTATQIDAIFQETRGKYGI